MLNLKWIKRKKQEWRLGISGFTLVELMVVVAIIGILSAVAIPNFKKYQAKSKSSEAKVQLSALYSAESSFYSDFSGYGTCLDIMGFDPSNAYTNRYYAVGFAAGEANANNQATNNGAPTACGGAGNQTNNATLTANSYVFGAGKKVGGANAPTTHVSGACSTCIVKATTFEEFTAAAVGVIDPTKTASTNADEWNINHLKKVTQQQVGY